MRDGVAVAERMAARTTNQERSCSERNTGVSTPREGPLHHHEGGECLARIRAQHFDLREAGVSYALALLLIVLGQRPISAADPNYFSATESDQHPLSELDDRNDGRRDDRHSDHGTFDSVGRVGRGARRSDNGRPGRAAWVSGRRRSRLWLLAGQAVDLAIVHMSGSTPLSSRLAR